MNVAVIPARGGSERIPRKNIRDFCGRPIIAYSIEVAKESGLFEHVAVSTEDREIASVAESLGAEVPFQRPVELADAHTGTVEVVSHAARWMLEAGWIVENICCIYATAPFVSAGDLARGLELLDAGEWSYVLTACEYPSTIFRSFRFVPADGIEMYFPEMYAKRSQDLPRALHDAGQFYWGKFASWLARKPLLASHSRPLVLPKNRVQDIDDEADWKLAEQMYRSRCT